MDSAFLKKLDEYHVHVETKSARKIKIGNLEYLKNNETKMDHILIALQFGVEYIGTKIANAVQHHEQIFKKLNDKVILDSNGRSISVPFQSKNTAGIYQNLKNYYSKPSMIVFNRMMIDFMSYEIKNQEMAKNPESIMQDFNQMLKQAESMQFFEYMTKDRFITMSMIKAYAPLKDMYSKLLNHMFEFIRKNEAKLDEEAALQYTPLYDEMCLFIKTDSRCSQFDNVTVKKNSSSVEKISRFSSKNYDGAASATVSSVPSPIMPRNSTDLFQDYTIAQAGYTRQVMRDEKLCITIRTHQAGSMKALYTATQNFCPLCATDNKHPKPFCFLGQCSKCHLFGHKALYCKQA
jgi:hypothetical protein